MLILVMFMGCYMHNLNLVSIREVKRSENSHIKFHSHKYHELVYYLSGNGKTEIDGKSFCFLDNNFSIIPAGIKHNEFHYANAEVICLVFSGLNDLQPGFFKDSSNTIINILNELINEIQKQIPGYKDMLEVKLNELIININRIEKTIGDTKSFEYVINYIRENFHKHINLSDCAKQLNISYDYFQHKFKSLTGLSPKQFLMEHRLLNSKKMLEEEAYNCTEIAYRCGFCTSAQFSALFKNKYGVTPLQYKKHITQKASDWSKIL